MYFLLTVCMYNRTFPLSFHAHRNSPPNPMFPCYQGIPPISQACTTIKNQHDTCMTRHDAERSGTCELLLSAFSGTLRRCGLIPRVVKVEVHEAGRVVGRALVAVPVPESLPGPSKPLARAVVPIHQPTTSLQTGYCTTHTASAHQEDHDDMRGGPLPISKALAHPPQT